MTLKHSVLKSKVDKKESCLIQGESMIKRKRPDARSFREWHIARAKKYKNPSVKETAPERRDTLLPKSSDNLEASSLREGECTSEACPSQSQQQRIDSEVKLQPCVGEATFEQYGSGVPEGCERNSSTNVQLLQITPGEMIEGEKLDSKDVHSVNHEKSGSDGTNRDEMEGESSVHKSELYDCKLSSSQLIEYWVPVGFSHVQLEKYCETLIKNLMLLCSSSKDIIDGLHDVLTTIKKCCDHPYLVDPYLEGFVNEGRSKSDLLSTGIEASGKLFLLDKILKEVKEKHSRVLIVFQSNPSNSRTLHLQDVLDDFICRRFGEESYVHIYKELDHSKKQAALDLFNDKEKGKFVILIEKSSCQPSIKISSVDLVILFNSDWCPINDMRSLRRMSIQSQSNHLKVFRLYSSNSVEEKVLILAKEGTVLDSSLHNFSHNICHMLLLWGTSYLFNKLDNFHSHCTSIASLDCLSEQKLVDGVFRELSSLLSFQDSNKSSCSLVSKVPEAKEEYSASISLYGEKDASGIEDDVPQYAIWNSLLEGRNPQWKLLPRFSQSKRKRGNVLESFCHYAECETKRNPTMHTKASHSRGECPSLNPSLRKKRSPAPRRKVGKVSGDPISDGNELDVLPCGNYNSISNVEEIFKGRMKTLLLKQKNEIREFYRTKREERTKLEKEHHLELDLIHERCIETELKLEELKKVDIIFREKVDEHNHQMDAKRKELDNVQRVRRIKEKQMKDRWHGCFMTKKLREQSLSPINAPLFDSELGSQSVALVRSRIRSPSVVSNTAQLSESLHSKGIDQGLKDGSCQDGDIGLPPDQLTETEILPVESDGENGAASMPRAALSNNTEHSDLAVVSETSLCEKQSHDLQHTLNRQVEGDGSTNIRSSKETLQGSVSKFLESDGENDVMLVSSAEAHDISIEPVNYVSDLRTSNESQLLSRQKDMETLPSLPNREVQDGDGTPVGASNGETNSGGANLETIVNPTESVEVVVTEHAKYHSDFGVCPNILPVGLVSRSLELNGEKNVGVMTSGEAPDNSPEPPNNVLCTSNEPQQCSFSGENCLEPLVTVPNRELSDREYDMEPQAGECNEETEGRGAADMGTTYTVATQQHIEDVSELHLSRLAGSCCVSSQPQTCTMSGNSSPPDKSSEPPNNVLCTSNEPQQCTLSGESCLEPLLPLPIREVHDREYNREPQIVECDGEADGGGVADLGTTSMVATQQHIDNVSQLYQPVLSRSCCVSLQPQLFSTSENSSLPDQPIVSAHFRCNQIRPTAGTLAVPNCPATGTRTLCQPHQFQVPMGNRGPCNFPLEQPTAIMSSPLQSAFGYDQLHISNIGGSTILRPANSYLQQTSSLRANIPPSKDPLFNELVRTQQEVDVAKKIYDDKMVHLKSACQKEIEGIHKKYDLLFLEAKNAFHLKKDEIGARYIKLSANKVLADTMQYHFQKQAASAISPEDLLTAVLQMSAPPHQIPEPRILRSAEPTAARAQVVHQLSELISVDPVTPPHQIPEQRNLPSAEPTASRAQVDPVTPQYGSALHTRGNPLVGCQPANHCSPAPHLRSTRPNLSMPMSNMYVPSYGMPSQQTLLHPYGSLAGSHHVNPASGFRGQLEGTRHNPVFL